MTRDAQRFYALDVLRGLAALGVVFWHWHHFFFEGTSFPEYRVTDQPFYGLFFVLYTKGWLAVDLFFALSGFIFHWLYARAIRERTISGTEFWLLRLSRLAPLHLVTLAVVGLGQLWYRSLFGAFFVYEHNDPFHLALNLGFASAWGLERGYSFNAPFWSVSVEMALYALFFVLCLVRRPTLLVALGLSALGFAVEVALYKPLGRGVAAFFLGGAVFLAFEWVRARRLDKALLPWLAGVTGLLWVGAVACASLDVSLSLGRYGDKLVSLWPRLLLFPATILTLALAEPRLAGARRLAFLGDVSYSSYLLHFPLQLVLVGAVRAAGLSQDVFYSWPALVGFYALLVPLSLLCYRLFERPAQRALRRSLIELRAPNATRKVQS